MTRLPRPLFHAGWFSVPQRDRWWPGLPRGSDGAAAPGIHFGGHVSHCKGFARDRAQIGNPDCLSEIFLSFRSDPICFERVTERRIFDCPLAEPTSGEVLHAMALEVGEEESLVRYRATIVASLRQLGNLANSRIRLWVTPDDAADAVRFWLLPRLSDRWRVDDGIFRVAAWELEFRIGHPEESAAAQGYAVQGVIDLLCPEIGARWVHAAVLGLGRTTRRAVAPLVNGSGCGFLAWNTAHEAPSIDGSPPTATPTLPDRLLPPVRSLENDADWQAFLEAPVGSPLRRAYHEELHLPGAENGRR